MSSNTSKHPYRRMGVALQRIFLLGILLFVLSRRDFAVAFGRKSGINRAHINPATVLSCAVQNEPAITNDYRFKQASVKAVRALAVPGFAMDDVAVGVIGKRLSDGKKKKQTTSGVHVKDLDEYMKDATKWVEKHKSDRGLLKVVRNNYMLIAGSLACVLAPVVGLIFREYGLSMFAIGMVATYSSVANQVQGQVTDEFTYMFVSLVVVYAVSDYMISYKASKKSKDSKQVVKKAAEADEWDDGFGWDNKLTKNAKKGGCGSGGCC